MSISTIFSYTFLVVSFINAKAVNDVPVEIDWRNKGIITKVKDQGDCEAGFYFAALGLLESYHYLSTGEVIDLSEQSILDCSLGYNNGCNGGGVLNSLAFIRDKGVALEKDYPYEAKLGQCNLNSSQNYFKTIGYEMLPKDEDLIKSIVGTVGPVAVTFDGGNLGSYSGGIYNDPNCYSNTLHHSGIIVGYGTTDEREDYWTVKMSYGVNWGENGYIRMARNTNNECDISNNAIYPIF